MVKLLKFGLPLRKRELLFDFDETNGHYRKRRLENQAEKTHGFAVELPGTTRKLLGVYGQMGEVWLSIGARRFRLLDPDVRIQFKSFLVVRRFVLAYKNEVLLKKLYAVPITRLLLADGQNDEFLDFYRYIYELPRSAERLDHLAGQSR